MRAGFQMPLTDPSMVQRVRHQGEGRVDDPQHRFLLETDIVQRQKQQAVRRKKKDRRESDSEKPEADAGDAKTTAEEEELAGHDPDCGNIVDIRV
jgi:hypothetical protein